MAVACEWISRRDWRVPLLPALASAACLAIAMMSAAASALAGQYHVYSCRTPSGESAPTDGWSPSEVGAESVALDTCSQPGGALVAGLRAQTPRTANADAATWAFAAPAGETIAAATLSRAGDTDGGWELYGTYQFWFAGPSETDIFGACQSVQGCPGKGEVGQPLFNENHIAVPAANLGPHLYVNASCGGMSGYHCPAAGGDSNGYAAALYVYAADLVLEQSAPPSASDVSGELASAPTVSGTSDLAFNASDPGSGVYEAVFAVDGKVVQSTVLDENGGRCKNVGETTDGLPAFLYVQPCAQSVSADVGWDTTMMGNGEHHLVVSVIDAAGNSATVLDRDVTIDNPPPPGGPNGTDASAQATLTVGWTTTRSVRLASGYGQAQTIVGRLTGAGGAPIGGAQIEVQATPAYTGARTATVEGVRTDADGRFLLRLAADASSRSLRFGYSDELGASPVVTKTLTLSVRAGVALRIAPRTASVGRSIRFSGRLPGGPIPSGGKLLVLEARSPGGPWLEFDVIRSDSHGRYHASYRFKFPGPARYQFRVLCEAEADYPFATGSSKVVGVFEH